MLRELRRTSEPGRGAEHEQQVVRLERALVDRVLGSGRPASTIGIDRVGTLRDGGPCLLERRPAGAAPVPGSRMRRPSRSGCSCGCCVRVPSRITPKPASNDQLRQLVRAAGRDHRARRAVEIDALPARLRRRGVVADAAAHDDAVVGPIGNDPAAAERGPQYVSWKPCCDQLSAGARRRSGSPASRPARRP